MAACSGFFVRLRGRFFVPAYVSVSAMRGGGQGEERSNPEPRAALYSEHGEDCEHRTLTGASTAQRLSLAGSPKPIPTGSGSFRTLDQASRPKVARVSGLAGASRRTGWRCRRRIRTAQGRAVDTDGDAVMLQAIEQCVDQRLFVEQPVPVWEVEVRGYNC